MLFRKRSASGSMAGEDAGRLLEASIAREQVHRYLSDGLLTNLRAFAIDVAELETGQFYDSVDQFKSWLQASSVDGSLSSRALDAQLDFIPEFIKNQQNYLQELSTELHNVVNILTKAVVEMNSQNSAYHSVILDQTETMAEINRLEDLRRLKASLSVQIGVMRDNVRKKQAGEENNIQSLAGQVEVLRTELEQVQQESRRDGLTGIYNRRAFDWFLSGLVNARSAQEQAFSLLIMDLDNFKEINDNYGHLVGDRVLLGVVAICRSVIRSEDFFARYGGDEFVVVFPGATARVAARKAKEICGLVRETRLTTEDAGKPLVLSLSVSLGVSASKSGDSGEDIIKRADMALYDAKKAGRNRVGVR